jgi:choline transport protein
MAEAIRPNEDPRDMPRVESRDPSDSLHGFDSDALKLAQMGYTQDMKRKYSAFSVLGVGFSLTNSWFGISAALVTGINSGGPVLIVYGIILIALITTCVGISLAELASAYPNAGGQYFWANELAPRRYANFASYLTGWFAWAGSIFTSASVAVAVGSAGVGCWQLSHPTLCVVERVPRSRMLTGVVPINRGTCS